MVRKRAKAARITFRKAREKVNEKEKEKVKDKVRGKTYLNAATVERQGITLHHAGLHRHTPQKERKEKAKARGRRRHLLIKSLAVFG